MEELFMKALHFLSVLAHRRISSAKGLWKRRNLKLLRINKFFPFSVNIVSLFLEITYYEIDLITIAEELKLRCDGKYLAYEVLHASAGCTVVYDAPLSLYQLPRTQLVYVKQVSDEHNRNIFSIRIWTQVVYLNFVKDTIGY